MAKLHDHVEYVKLVKDIVEQAKASGHKVKEEATKLELLAPFFTMLGYDLADPKECVPEYAAQFGTEQFPTKVDWVFCREGCPLFMVEAKALHEPLQPAWMQLYDYFSEQPNVKVGILTNGAEWRFYTDLNSPNALDTDPFARWDIYSDEPAPIEVFKLLKKPNFDAETIRELARKTRRDQQVMNDEVKRLLAPSEEFIKLAIKKETIEPHRAGVNIVEYWRPFVASALTQWARRTPAAAGPASPTVSHPSKDATNGDDGGGTVAPTPEEQAAFAAVQQVLGGEPIGCEALASYFTIHLPEKTTWIFTRLKLRQHHRTVSVPLPPERTTELAGGRPVTPHHDGWTVVSIGAGADLVSLGDLFRAAHAHVRKEKLGQGA